MYTKIKNKKIWEPMEKKILVVDDDKVFLKEMAGVLSDKGFDVKTCLDSMGVIKKTLEFKPDIILLDLNMSHLNGFEIAIILKNMLTTKNIPILALSGRYKPTDHWLVSFDNFDGWIGKGAPVDRILEEVRSVLNESAQNTEMAA